MQTIELLAPAKNLECGKAAIDHGADAVYIGASRFGARQQAGNSIADIEALCQYAHQFGARVHVTVNTIIYDQEMEETLRLVRELVAVGVDALLVQDMGLLQRIKQEGLADEVALHASTQCDSRSAAKVRWLSEQGMNRVVLAREMSVEEIAQIHEANPDVQLEVFVHGALCVSYSGVCYASQYCFGRSANRGECAQFCRLPFDLVDADYHTILSQSHLLSLKDLCQVDRLEELAQAGACSFKIEGRLKDINYVKNVVAAYSAALDKLVEQHPKRYCRASLGRSVPTFEPNLDKTFNRGYTHYFLHGRQPNIFSPHTPKALGEYVGKVKELRRDSFNVAGTASFANGDGLCYLNSQHQLEGFRVNKVVGNRLYPFKMPTNLHPGQALYRNQDQVFEHALHGETAKRKIPIYIRWAADADGVRCQVTVQASASFPFIETHCEKALPLEKAQKPQEENVRRQWSKLGASIFSIAKIDFADEATCFFVPNSIISEIRQTVCDSLQKEIADYTLKTRHVSRSSSGVAQPLRISPLDANAPQYADTSYLFNIANEDAAAFYQSCGMAAEVSAFELTDAHRLTKPALVMQCRHCLRYSLGYCVRRGGKKPQWKEPLFLELKDRGRFKLEFDCKNCQMNVYAI